MKKQLFLGLTLGLMVLGACNKKQQNTETKQPIIAAEHKAGMKLLQQNCYVCHSPTASEKARIAPPMEAIKRHYISEGTTEEQFAQKIVDFVKHPTKEKSLMPNAVNRFGLMQPMPFSKEKLTEIANAMYHTELPRPDWFEEHFNNEKPNVVTPISNVQYGKKLALQTKGILGGNLMAAIQEKGTDGALEFCSTKAMPLTDSMSVALNASIKRVSDKNRNPINAANKEELAYIKTAKEQLKNGLEITPKITQHNGKNIGYYPIMTKGMCMQCHGEKDTQIKTSTLEKINKHYPNDKATGYKENELRGIWVVEFNELKNN